VNDEDLRLQQEYYYIVWQRNMRAAIIFRQQFILASGQMSGYS